MGHLSKLAFAIVFGGLHTPKSQWVYIADELLGTLYLCCSIRAPNDPKGQTEPNDSKAIPFCDIITFRVSFIHCDD